MNDITPPTAWTPDGEKPMAAASNLPTEDALIEAMSQARAVCELF